ncbi:phage tail length tape measure family protein, partial [Escherichia coli]|nr:phage tail length tape measure family protein [Escherichia coli]
MHWLKMPGMPVSWDDLCQWPVWRQVAGLPYWPRLLPPPGEQSRLTGPVRSLILTGGAAATTTAELWKMARVISDEAGGYQTGGRKSGPSGRKREIYRRALRIMGETSQRWLQTVGDDAGKVEKAFEGIAADPVKALASLNQQYNFLSVSQLRHIDELERTKGKQAAVTEAMSLFADVMNA